MEYTPVNSVMMWQQQEHEHQVKAINDKRKKRKCKSIETNKEVEKP